MTRLNDRQRIIIGRTMAALSALGAVFGVTVYIGLGLAAELYDEWILHNSVGAITLAGLFWFMVGAQPKNRAVWVLGWSAVFQALGMFGIAVETWSLEGTGTVDSAGLARADASFWTALGTFFADTTWLPGIAVLVTLALLWFPDGNPATRRWKPVVWLAIAAISVCTAGLAWSARWFGSGVYPSDEDVSAAFDVAMPFIGVAVLLSIAALVIKYRRSRGIERQQFRWVVWAMGVLAPIWVAANVSDAIADGSSGGGSTFKLVSLITFPLLFGGYGIAIWRHQLFDIDVVISRTLLFGFLAVFIGAVYVAIVFGIGALIGQTSDNNALSLLATIVVAFGFQPVRRRVEHAANRLVYGKRATPYEVLSELTNQLNQAETSAGLLDRIAQGLAEGTGADTATVWRHENNEFLPAATWPTETDAGLTLPDDAAPIERAGQTLGALSVTKPRGEELNPTEQRLIGDLAGSAGLILDKARLDTALTDQAQQLFDSRRRLADAQDDERQRLQRHLQNTTQQQLIHLKTGLENAATGAQREAADLAIQIDNLAGDSQAAIDEIEALAQGIYPPLLETDGLIAAIERLATSLPISTTVTTGGRIRHDFDIETAIYFCIAEALTNVVKHAEATHTAIHIDTTQHNITFTVTDNGHGFDPTSRNGQSTGITGLTDRLETIGGHITMNSQPGAGTTITGTSAAARVSV